MDDSIKKKYNIAFGVFLLLIMAIVFIWLPSIYFFGYINKEDIIKIHFSMFFYIMRSTFALFFIWWNYDSYK